MNKAFILIYFLIALIAIKIFIPKHINIRHFFKQEVALKEFTEIRGSFLFNANFGLFVVEREIEGFKYLQIKRDNECYYFISINNERVFRLNGVTGKLFEEYRFEDKEILCGLFIGSIEDLKKKYPIGTDELKIKKEIGFSNRNGGVYKHIYSNIDGIIEVDVVSGFVKGYQKSSTSFL